MDNYALRLFVASIFFLLNHKADISQWKSDQVIFFYVHDICFWFALGYVGRSALNYVFKKITTTAPDETKNKLA